MTHWPYDLIFVALGYLGLAALLFWFAEPDDEDHRFPDGRRPW